MKTWHALTVILLTRAANGQERTNLTDEKPLLKRLDSPVLFRGNDTTAYRDPSLYYHKGDGAHFFAPLGVLVQALV